MRGADDAVVAPVSAGHAPRTCLLARHFGCKWWAPSPRPVTIHRHRPRHPAVAMHGPSPATAPCVTPQTDVPRGPSRRTPRRRHPDGRGGSGLRDECARRHTRPGFHASQADRRGALWCRRPGHARRQQHERSPLRRPLRQRDPRRGSGDDYIEGGTGSDRIDAGEGNNTIFASSGRIRSSRGTATTTSMSAAATTAPCSATATTCW